MLHPIRFRLVGTNVFATNAGSGKLSRTCFLRMLFNVQMLLERQASQNLLPRVLAEPILFHTRELK